MFNRVTTLNTVTVVKLINKDPLNTLRMYHVKLCIKVADATPCMRK